MYKLSEQLMQMNEDAWKRHANPLSVYTRYTALPFLALSVWSRYWLGWDALYPLFATFLWIWLNPRLFPAPKSLDSWASRGVMGEQLFLNRAQLVLPKPLLQGVHSWTALSVLGVIAMMYGLWQFNLIATIAGMLVAMVAKTIFLDRMVKLYDHVSAATSKE